MAQTVSPVLPQAAAEAPRADTNHFIIWLDQHIGLQKECVLLKCTFCLAIDPTTGDYERSLNVDDIDRSLQLEAPLMVKFDEVVFMFQVFDSVEKCFETIERNLHKRIFLITSGSKGKILIPSLVVNFPQIFSAEYWMYVFCANMNMVSVGDVHPTNTWALHYADRILMYDHQDNLLRRMVSDIACYFSNKAEQLANDHQFDDADQHFSWAKQMYKRYGTIAQKSIASELNKIEEQVRNIKQLRKQQQPDGDEDAIGEACDE